MFFYGDMTEVVVVTGVTGGVFEESLDDSIFFLLRKKKLRQVPESFSQGLFIGFLTSFPYFGLLFSYNSFAIWTIRYYLSRKLEFCTVDNVS